MSAQELQRAAGRAQQRQRLHIRRSARVAQAQAAPRPPAHHVHALLQRRQRHDEADARGALHRRLRLVAAARLLRLLRGQQALYLAQPVDGCALGGQGRRGAPNLHTINVHSHCQVGA